MPIRCSFVALTWVLTSVGALRPAGQVIGYVFGDRGADPAPLRHLVFVTSKPSVGGLRAAIENASASSFRRPSVTLVSFAKGLESSEGGVPTLRSLFQAAFDEHPEADTYTYVNSDIAIDSSFVATADAVVRATREKVLRDRFLVVGRRTNVDWGVADTVSDANFMQIFKQGKLANWTAEDYFMVSKESFDWSKVPAFIVGSIGFDNWLVRAANLDPEMDAVDATETLRAIHMTDPSKGDEEGYTTQKDPFYNWRLMNLRERLGLMKVGTTKSTHWMTRLAGSGRVEFVERPPGGADAAERSA